MVPGTRDIKDDDDDDDDDDDGGDDGQYDESVGQGSECSGQVLGETSPGSASDRVGENSSKADGDQTRTKMMETVAGDRMEDSQRPDAVTGRDWMSAWPSEMSEMEEDERWKFGV
jgi:hypothetical protein